MGFEKRKTKNEKREARRERIYDIRIVINDIRLPADVQHVDNRPIAQFCCLSGVTPDSTQCILKA